MQMENTQKKSGIILFIFALSYYCIFALVSILSCTLHGVSWVQAAKYGILAVLFFSFLLYTSDNERIFGDWKRRLSGPVVVVLSASGLLSGLLLVAAPWQGMDTLWFFSAVAVAVFLGSAAGFGVHLSFCMLWFALHEETPAGFCALIVMGAFYCFLNKYFTEIANLVFITLMMVLLKLSLLFIENDFMLAGLEECFCEIIGCLLLIAAEFFLVYLKGIFLIRKKNKRRELVLFREKQLMTAEEEKAEEYVEEMMLEREPQVEEAEGKLLTESEKIRNKLREVEKPEYVLMARLERASKALYEHSRLVGDTAAEAARQIGADELLARVGGYYHEIGRLRTDGVKRSYIENGLIHLREHEFPEEVMDIVRQHNIKREMPKSKEAALVMISDSVFSMIEYIRQQGNCDKAKQYEVVENMLRLRLREGNLDDSGLSVRDFNTLKEYYLKLVETA